MNEQQSAHISSKAIGYTLAILQAVFYATIGIFGKLLYASGLDVQQTVILRFLMTTLILGVFMAIWRKEPLVSKQPGVYLQAVFFFISAIFYFYAVERLSAGITTVLFYMYPVVVALLSLFVFKEKLTRPIVIALILTIGGLVFVSGVFQGDIVLDGLGIVYALTTCISFAIYTVLIQKTGRTEGSFTVTFTLSWTSLIASCIIFFPTVPSILHFTPYQIGIGALLSLLSTILPIVMYIAAIKRIGGTRASLIGISETPSSLLLAFFILGETISWLQLVGTILIVLGILVVTLASNGPPKKKTS